MPSSYDITHSEKNEIVVCEFNTNELLMEEKSTDMDMPGLGTVKIMVYSGEGTNCPHFHIIRNTKEKISCICLYEPRYFVHNGYVSILNSRQRKQLNIVLKEPHGNEDETNWEFMSNFWLNNNDPMGLYADRRDSKQPDYTKLKGYIRE